MPDHVFGYGSLVASPADRPAELRGFRRHWGVAMDNEQMLPGYKVYRTAQGAQPAVCVAFLDIRPDPDGVVNGVCAPATADALAALDRRERNYERVDVTAGIADAPGRVWAFVGREESRARLRAARAERRAVVHAGYVRDVEAAFRALGAGAYERFQATTEPHGLPVVELERVDLPGAPG